MFKKIINYFRNPEKKYGTGGMPEIPDVRDYKHDEVVAKSTPVRWVEKSKSEWKTYPKFDQDGSGSCVGQTVAKMLGVENVLEEDRFVHFSARDIYSRGYVEPGGGMYGREAMKIGKEHGATLEQLMPSQQMGEKQMRVNDSTVLSDQIALIGKGGDYIFLYPIDFDSIAEVLDTGKTIGGGVSFNSGGFRNGEVKLSDGGKYRHWITYVDYTMWKGQKALVFDNSWGCYDENTEILTDEGWKLFKDLKENEIVATLNPDNHNLEYQEISEKQIYDYNDYLWHYKGRDIDLLVTPNHKLYYKSITNNTDWKLQQANQIDIKHFKMKKNAEWKGKEKEKCKVGGKELSMDLWLEFLGYFISEGHTNLNEFWRSERIREKKYKIKGDQPRSKKTGKFTTSSKEKRIEKKYTTKENPYPQFSYTTGISQKERNYKIQKCLDKLPWKFVRYNYTWTTNNKDLYLELKKLGKSYEKFIPNYVKEMSSRQLEILLDALMLGDGSGKPLKKWTYYTSSKQLADDVQELLLKIGYAGDISYTNRIGRKNNKGITRHIEYAVGIKTSELEQAKRNGFLPKKILYQGIVYCVTVPNHIVYVRRNGKAVWSGNSDWGFNGQGIITEDQINGMYSTWYYKHLRNDWRDVDETIKPIYIFLNTLRVGDRNNDVVVLQDILKYEGLFPTNVESTGNYFGITSRSVYDFQVKYNVAGMEELNSLAGTITGPKTRKKLNELYGE